MHFDINKQNAAAMERVWKKKKRQKNKEHVVSKNRRKKNRDYQKLFHISTFFAVVFALGIIADAAVARCAPNLAAVRALFQCLDDGVLAAAASQE